jgi:hypothetical protein
MQNQKTFAMGSVPNNGNKLEHKKRGAREGSPSVWGVVFFLLLECESEAELQLPHANGSARCGIRLDVTDLATV